MNELDGAAAMNRNKCEKGYNELETPRADIFVQIKACQSATFMNVPMLSLGISLFLSV